MTSATPQQYIITNDDMKEFDHVVWLKPLFRKCRSHPLPTSTPEPNDPIPDFSETVKKCCNCERCTPIGKRKGHNGIRDGRFDTKEQCCSTRRHGRECPRVLAAERKFEQEQHNARIRASTINETLDKVSEKANSYSETAELPCQDGWHTGDHPTEVIRISYLEKELESLRQPQEHVP
jgi:hypothetical protein